MDNLKEITGEAMAILQKAMRAEFAAQGHGGEASRLSKSIDYTVEVSGNTATGRMFFEDYGIYVEMGVTANRIPYGKGKGKPGGTSEYIQGLVTFWQRRGLSGRNALGAAFATAKVHAREGMPTRASRRFSSTGRRTGFVRDALKDALPEMNEFLTAKFAALVEIQFERQFAGHQIERHEISI